MPMLDIASSCASMPAPAEPELDRLSVSSDDSQGSVSMLGAGSSSTSFLTSAEVDVESLSPQPNIDISSSPQHPQYGQATMDGGATG